MRASTHAASADHDSPVPFLMPYAREVRRAIEGDVPGQRPLKALSFPKRLLARRRMVHGMSSFIAAARHSSEEERIQFARKLAVHIIRDNWQPLGSDIRLGVQWFALNRTALPSRLSFSGAIRLQKVKQKRDLDEERKTALARWHADMMVPDVPMPVIFAEQGYQLRKLETTRHLVRMGIAANNCLARRIGKTYVPNERYWNQLNASARHIFALHQDDSLRAVFSIMPPDLGEIQFLAERASVADAMERSIPAIESAMGHPVPKIFRSWIGKDETPFQEPFFSHQPLTPPRNRNAEGRR